METHFIDLRGMYFGRLYVLAKIRRPSRARGSARFKCICECGKVSCHRSDHLRSGRCRSCGCLRSELSSAKATTHGHTKGKKYSSEFAGWCAMLSRCKNSSQQSFALYGAKGIRVCSRWSQSFVAFLADMGRKPSKTHSIDRIDYRGNYEPSNCRWATLTQQGRNKSSNRILCHNGAALTMVEWSERTGIKQSTICMRLNRYGWNVCDALTIKPRRKSRSA
jgi:hypothetical protein